MRLFFFLIILSVDRVEERERDLFACFCFLVSAARRQVNGGGGGGERSVCGIVALCSSILFLLL